MTHTYPRHVHRRDGVYRVIETADQLTQAVADGWQELPDRDWPVPDVYREWVPGDDLSAPVAPPKRRGRPRKAEA